MMFRSNNPQSFRGPRSSTAADGNATFHLRLCLCPLALVLAAFSGSLTAATFTGSPSSGQQLTTTFSYSGTGLTPNASIQQHFQGPSGSSSGTIQSNGSGQVSWTYVYKCSDTPGTWYT